MLKKFMGKSQNTPQLAVGMNGKRGFGGCRPHIGFFLRRCPAAFLIDESTKRQPAVSLHLDFF
jgi:hypothetical protein